MAASGEEILLWSISPIQIIDALFSLYETINKHLGICFTLTSYQLSYNKLSAAILLTVVTTTGSGATREYAVCRS